MKVFDNLNTGLLQNDKFVSFLKNIPFER